MCVCVYVCVCVCVVIALCVCGVVFDGLYVLSFHSFVVLIRVCGGLVDVSRLCVFCVVCLG